MSDVTLAGAPIAVYLLASMRIIAWMLVAPPFSNRAIPVMAKVIISLGLALGAVPTVSMKSLPDTNSGMLAIALSQILIGLGLGFITMLLFQAIATAGRFIDQFAGMTATQAFDPLSMNVNSVFGRLHEMIAMALLFVTGAHLVIIGGLLNTFKLLPLTTPFTDANLGMRTVTTAFRLFLTTAVQIALPMIAVLFVVDLGLALLTKVAPQLNAMAVMFPAKIALTLLIIGMTFPALVPAVQRLTEYTLQATNAIAGGG